MTSPLPPPPNTRPVVLTPADPPLVLNVWDVVAGTWITYVVNASCPDVTAKRNDPLGGVSGDILGGLVIPKGGYGHSPETPGMKAMVVNVRPEGAGAVEPFPTFAEISMRIDRSYDAVPLSVRAIEWEAPANGLGLLHDRGGSAPT
jgi:hypothetical protein